jgi:diguanylate cyclase (GGDEF)-like protein
MTIEYPEFRASGYLSANMKLGDILIKQIKSTTVNKKIVILPFFLIFIAYLVVTITSVNGRIEYYRNHMMEDSIEYAKSYAIGISKSAEARDTLNELLEERLLVASRSTILLQGELDNERLAEMAERYRVDALYFYSPEGEILYSSNGEDIGWRATEGHPVYEFMNNPLEFQAEEIRQDSESNQYFKYGYFQREDGSFVQVGIYAAEIYDFIGSFEMQQLLDEIKGAELVHSLYFIDENLEIVSSTSEDFLGASISNPDLVDAIRRNKEYNSTVEIDGEELYYGLVPIYIEDDKIGTLAVAQSTEDMDLVISEAVKNGLYNLTSVFIVIGFFAAYIIRNNKQLVEMAYYDNLTGLPNQAYLKEYIQETLRGKKLEDKAILLVNIENFRHINMTYGYDFGDDILREIARRLKSVVGGSHLVTRFTSDRFVVFVEGQRDKKQLVRLAESITEALDKPIENSRNRQYINSQIAIVESIRDYFDVDNLLREVSIALDHLPRESSVNYIFFSEDMGEKVSRWDAIEKEIRDFVLTPNSETIYLDYQPKVDLKTGRISGFEALARMNSEDLGRISPIEFIDVAEKRLIIAPLGYRLLEMAVGFAKKMDCDWCKDATIAVNISGIQLLRDDFVDRVKGIIDRYDLEPGRLELEITESILLDNYHVINEKLKVLRDIGIEISLDDFGTGYSSLSRLGELNVGVIKIDRYFIKKIDNQTEDSHLTHDIISMAHKSGLKVVAEGVETMDQLEYLRRNHCDYMQGYLFSRPVSPEEALKLLQSTNKDK